MCLEYSVEELERFKLKDPSCERLRHSQRIFSCLQQAIKALIESKRQ
jgi:hypothetical protein